MDFCELKDNYKTPIEKLLNQHTQKRIIKKNPFTKKKTNKLKRLPHQLKIWMALKNRIENRKDFSNEFRKVELEFSNDQVLIEKIKNILPRHAFKETQNGSLKIFYNILGKLIYIRPNNEKLQEISEYIISSNTVD